MPMGQMPVLEIDGKKYHQSIAICQFLAKKVGLVGKNDLEDMEINSMVETIVDFRTSERVMNYI
jgi:prostaglandin-H2 D-isomerase / glutathione transferase